MLGVRILHILLLKFFYYRDVSPLARSARHSVWEALLWSVRVKHVDLKQWFMSRDPETSCTDCSHRNKLHLTMPLQYPYYFEMSVDFFCSLFDANLCWIASAFNDKDLISPLSHDCRILSRAFKWPLFFEVLLGFCNNNAVILCIASRLIDVSGVSCVV